MINGIAFVIGMLLLALGIDNGLTNIGRGLTDIAKALSGRKDFTDDYKV